MNRNVLAVLLAVTAFAGADTGEFLLDHEVAYAAAENDQLHPAAASDGTNSLVVWIDGRSGPTDIYGVRLAPDGTVLDPAGIVISNAANGQISPAVASDGAGFLVAWADQRGDSSDIYVSRVNSEGLVLDPAGIPVALAPGLQREPAATFDGTNYLVVWTDERGGDADIYGARVTPGGIVVDTSGIPLIAAPEYQTTPAVAYDGTNTLLVWEDTRNDILGDIYAARVTSEGAVLDSTGFVVSAASNWQGGPGIAFGRDEALVVWHDQRAGTDVDVYGSRITSAGEVLDTSGVEISTITNNQWYPKVAFDGTNYLVVWVDAAGHANIFGGRVGTDGTLLDPQGFLISDGEYEATPAVTFNGAHNAVVWYDLHPGAGGYDIYAARVNGEGVLLDPGSIALSTSAITQRRPKAASGAAEFLVVWDEIRERSRGIHGVRLTPEGGVFDTLGIRVSPVGGDQTVPAVARGTRDFLVVWEEGRNRDRDVRGARVRADGAVMDPTGILISGAAWEQCAPEVASDGNDFLVVWQDWRNNDYDIYCARFSHSGVLLDTAGIAVCTAAGWQITPAVAGNGTNYLVLWQGPTSGDYNLYGTRISPQGVVLDPGGFVVSAAPGIQQQPAAASDGTDFLVAWSDGRNVDCNVYAARVTAAGTVLDTAGILLFSAAGPQYAPAVEYDGTNYLVVWTNGRNGERDIYGARVTPQGSVIDTFAVTTGTGDDFDPALARGPGGGMLTAYSSWAGDVEEEPYNSLRTWGVFSPTGGTSDRSAPAGHFTRPATSIVSGMMFLPEASSPNPQAASLLDISGRKVLDLRSGANDVRTLAPGVYFVRRPETEDGRPSQVVRKIVLTE